MRILFSFDGSLSPLGYGGGHQVLRGFARALSRAGHDVCVVVSGGDEIGAGAEDIGVEYRPQQLAWGRARFVKTALATMRAARSWRADFVCCFSAEVALVAPACRASRIPVAAYLAAPQIERISLRDPRAARRNSGQALQRLGALASNVVMTTSEHTARQAIALWGTPAARTFAVGQGLDEAYLDAPLRPIERAPGAPLRLLSVGRVSLTQKPLDAMAQGLVSSGIPWAHWTIIGSGEHDDALRTRIGELGIADRVHMLGFAPPREVARHLGDHDLVLLPSRYESFFLTVYEALACQRMVVTNDVAEVASALGGSPRLVLARDTTPGGYADALREAWRRLEAPAPEDDDVHRRIRRQHGWEAACARFLAATRGQEADLPGRAWRSAP